MDLLGALCWLSILLLLQPCSARPSDAQSLKELLQEDFREPEELPERDVDSLKAVFGTPEVGPWEDLSNSALADKENTLARLLKDLVRTSKRSWSRYKKGGMRSCFGVRLERIGSFSGLGC